MNKNQLVEDIYRRTMAIRSQLDEMKYSEYRDNLKTVNLIPEPAHDSIEEWCEWHNNPDSRRIDGYDEKFVGSVVKLISPNIQDLIGFLLENVTDTNITAVEIDTCVLMNPIEFTLENLLVTDIKLVPLATMSYICKNSPFTSQDGGKWIEFAARYSKILIPATEERLSVTIKIAGDEQ